MWLFKVSLISLLSFLFFLVIYFFRFSHKIEKRNIWDCGSEYRGSEVSVPSSEISDPLYNSMGRYFIGKDGEPYLDQFIKDNLIRVLNLGKYWIQQVESGEISYYILFSALSFILSIFVIISIKAYI